MNLFILFYNIVLVLLYIDLNPPWVYMCSPFLTPLPTPSPSHPSGSSQCTIPEHPVSCIEPGLEIRFTYDNLHVLIPPCALSSLAFHMMHSACKLNKQGDNRQP